MPEESSVVTHIGEPIHISISRNAKGNIQYEVSVHMSDAAECKRITTFLEDALYAKYKDQLGRAV